MTNRTEKLSLLMAYKSGNTFKLGHLADAKFSFTPMGEVAAFVLVDQPANDMRFVTLENGEGYNWDSSPDHIFLPLKISISDDLIEWTLANGMPGSTEPEDGDNQDEFDQIAAELQANFAYLREQAIRKEPVVIYQHGLPTDAYLDSIDWFLEGPFRAEDYEEWFENRES